MALVLKQYYLGCLAHASYLVGDTESGVAAVVDPQRDVDQYVQEAAKRKLRIKHVLLTHFHADFISGHLELRRLTGATIHLGARAKAAYRFHKLSDGDRLKLGRVTLEALETPGHTPEAVCFVARDGEKIKAVLTGDTLFIGDVGRPDLMASVGVTARQLASQLYDSLREKLLALPDDTLVYPAHGAGSLCGRNLSSDTVSTIGRERAYNYALKPMTRAAFIKLVIADQPEAPAYFAKDAAINRQARPTLERALEKGLKPLTPAQALRRAAAGAQLLDTRDPADFAAGHIPGSLNVGLGGKFATFAGMLLDLGKPIVLIADKGKERESALRLARVGFDRVAGFVDGGAAAAHAAGAPLASFTRLTADQLRERLGKRGAPAVLDVRNPGEREASAIKGSAFIPLAQLPKRLAEAPKGPLVVTCAGGYRSAMAVSLLMAAGRSDVSDLDGGMNAWNETAAACAAR